MTDSKTTFIEENTISPDKIFLLSTESPEKRIFIIRLGKKAIAAKASADKNRVYENA